MVVVVVVVVMVCTEAATTQNLCGWRTKKRDQTMVAAYYPKPKNTKNQNPPKKNPKKTHEM